MRTKLTIILLSTLLAGSGFAQNSDRDKEELQMMALEALMAAPTERALPAILKVLEGNGSDELKENALYVLGQLEHPDAAARLLEFAKSGKGELRLEAIRMIGINGNRAAMDSLPAIYADGNKDVREAVLEAYLIADDVKGVFDIAVNARDEDDYEEAVETLGAMDAHAELAQLRELRGVSDALIEAYIISDDDASLRAIALDSSDPELQAEAIEALGIVGADGTDAVLAGIYRDSESEDIRDAALEGLLIGNYDKAILQLYRASSSYEEKRDLLEALVIMDSELAMEVIDAALAGDR